MANFCLWCNLTLRFPRRLPVSASCPFFVPHPRAMARSQKIGSSSEDSQKIPRKIPLVMGCTLYSLLRYSKVMIHVLSNNKQGFCDSFNFISFIALFQRQDQISKINLTVATVIPWLYWSCYDWELSILKLFLVKQEFYLIKQDFWVLN